MARQPGCFDVDDRLAEFWAKGNDLERLNAVVDFERFARIWAVGSAQVSLRRRPATVRSCVHVQSADLADEP